MKIEPSFDPRPRHDTCEVFEVFDRKGNWLHDASLVLGYVPYFLEGQEEVLCDFCWSRGGRCVIF